MNNMLVILLFLTLAVSGQQPMDSEEAAGLRERVKAKAESTETIASDFTQYKHFDFLSEDIESSGSLSFKAPDKVKWEYREPYAHSMIFKDNRLYIDAEGKKSTLDMGSSGIAGQLNAMVTASIRGDMFDTAEFDISYFKEKTDAIVHFRPKDGDFASLVKTIVIRFNDTGEVSEVKLVEPSQDYTHILFRNRIDNQPLSDAVFDP